MKITMIEKESEELRDIVTRANSYTSKYEEEYLKTKPVGYRLGYRTGKWMKYSPICIMLRWTFTDIRNHLPILNG